MGENEFTGRLGSATIVIISLEVEGNVHSLADANSLLARLFTRAGRHAGRLPSPARLALATGKGENARTHATWHGQGGIGN